MATRESSIESYLCKQVHEQLNGRAYKFNSPGYMGVPDRLCLLPGGVMFFCEVKRFRGALSPLQKDELETLVSWGFNTYVIRSKANVDKLIASAKKGIINGRDTK